VFLNAPVGHQLLATCFDPDISSLKQYYIEFFWITNNANLLIAAFLAQAGNNHPSK